MTAPPQEPGRPDPATTSESESRISAALAASRVTGPTPHDVTARLEATLADLVTERDEHRDQSTRQVAAPARRLSGRSRRWLLLTAAAVVAVGVAFSVPGLRPHVSGQSSSASNSSAGKAAPKSLDRSARSRGPGTDTRLGASAQAQAPIRLRSGSFDTDVRALLSRGGGDALAQPRGSARSQSDGIGGCAVDAPAGVTGQRQVLLDGKPALLQVFRARQGERLVRAVSCGGGRTLASTRVPTP